MKTSKVDDDESEDGKVPGGMWSNKCGKYLVKIWLGDSNCDSIDGI